MICKMVVHLSNRDVLMKVLQERKILYLFLPLEHADDSILDFFFTIEDLAQGRDILSEFNLKKTQRNNRNVNAKL